ncbi:hypothetical protein F5887DRAFT_920514 [Amanita rubescens]|nr:hypothetical protein F5887DRAFT_920514 [Amanita rubescens]
MLNDATPEWKDSKLDSTRFDARKMKNFRGNVPGPHYSPSPPVELSMLFQISVGERRQYYVAPVAATCHFIPLSNFLLALFLRRLLRQNESMLRMTMAGHHNTSSSCVPAKDKTGRVLGRVWTAMLVVDVDRDLELARGFFA